MHILKSHSTLFLVMSLSANLANASIDNENHLGRMKLTSSFEYASKLTPTKQIDVNNNDHVGRIKLSSSFKYASKPTLAKKVHANNNDHVASAKLSSTLEQASKRTPANEVHLENDDYVARIKLSSPLEYATQEQTPFSAEQKHRATVVASADTDNLFGIRDAGFELDHEQSRLSDTYNPYPSSARNTFQLAAAERRRPGEAREPDRPEPTQVDPNKNTDLRPIGISNPNLPHPVVPVPDRYRIVEAIGVNERWYDPYNQNTLKGDRPIFGTKDWFFSIGLISDTVFEPRRLPTPVAAQSSRNPGALDVFGGREQTIFSETLIAALVLYKGDTAFKPPDHEFRLTVAYNYNRVDVEENGVLNSDPRRGNVRKDSHVGIQELFWDKHLRNVSDRYDFDSLRIGIQPFNADFRGFLFQDQQFGIRLFGNRDNNFLQYNLAWFRRIEKEINSGLNDVTESLRDDDVFIANVYKQDFPVLGHVSQATIIHNRNREGDEGQFFDTNGFLQRPAPVGNGSPRNYDVTYLGYNGDGHFGRVNLTTSYYYATGSETRNALFDGKTRIDAFFVAAEASIDFDWIRLRLSGLYASGDKDPFDNKSQGFDAIFENPLIAGADTSFWIRQPVANIGGGGVALSGRNGVLNSLRTSKELGQSNFLNPGTTLIGVGADFDLTPEWRVSVNANKLGFADTSSLEVFRQVGSIDNDIGWDLSVSGIYRPFFSQNIVFRLSGAALIPGEGFEDLYGDETSYSILANLLLTY